MKISFCLITLNEAANLARCLRSCADLADEIVVVDSGSTDGTEGIARDFGARWVSQAWLGFVGQKNLALSLATHEWVFSLDADEELSAELRAEIGRLKADGTSQKAASPISPTPVSGYRVPRCVFYEGRWIRHGDWYPDWLVRLFRKEGARFVGSKVHERLEIASGQVATLTGELHHYSFRDAADHWARCQQYARLWAESEREAKRTAWLGAPMFHAVSRWLRGYVWRRGFLDGSPGWRIAWMNAREAHLKYRLLREGTTTRGGRGKTGCN